MINTDHWNERWPDHPVIRTFEPARPVKVDIGRALPLGRGGASRADHVSMRVKTSALYMSGYLDGALKFWARMHDGQWLACSHSSALTTDHSATIAMTCCELSLWTTRCRIRNQRCSDG